MGNQRGRTQYRVQHKGYTRAPEILETAFLDDASPSPTIEKIPRRKQTPTPAETARIFDTVVRIERRVDVNPGSSEEFINYATKFADRNRQLAVKNVGSMAVTFYPGHVMRRALHDRYRGYGKDLRVTEDVHRGMSESFRIFVRSALVIRREAEKFDLYDGPFYREMGDSALVMPDNPLADAWVDAVAVLKQRPRVLDNRYVVADLSANEFLEEERGKISDFLRNEEGLKVDNRPYSEDRIPHLTFAETRGEVLKSYPLEAAALPFDVQLKAPEMYVKIGTPIFM